MPHSRSFWTFSDGSENRATASQRHGLQQRATQRKSVLLTEVHSSPHLQDLLCPETGHLLCPETADSSALALTS